ncbi:MAG: PilZ domain-containing protein [Myxococcales bacterium]|nr:PilZ domain-containing protein [Myxococcales bacterium]
MSPTDWTSLAEWVTAFRALHAQARKSKLDKRDQARYEQDREVLAKALLIAQRLSIKPGVTPRQTLRVSLQLPVELEGGGRREKTTTLDLGVGGFATMLPKPMSVLHRFGFVLTLKDGKSVSGGARVVNVQRKGKPFRVAFAFEDLPQAEAERISLEVFDAALATIPPV